MVVKNKETAEQKLLKMIETSSDATATSSKQEQKIVKKQNVLTIIKTCNRVLLAGIGVILLLSVYEVAAGSNLLNKSVNLPTKQKIAKHVKTDAGVRMPQIQKLSFYLAAVDRRNIFQPYEEKAAKNVDASGKNSRIARETQKLRLVGVSWLDKIDTASVMIEDTEKNMTYFLKKGEKIGNIYVKTIYADSAVLGYENEEIIIRYDKSQM